MKNGTSGFEFDHWMQSSPDTLLVYMRGQMVYETLDATDGCWQAVRHAFRRSVLLDFSQVTYLASAALGSLCGLRRWLVRFEGQGTLHTLNAAVAIGVIAAGLAEGVGLELILAAIAGMVAGVALALSFDISSGTSPS